jgi:DNA-binding NarL/FixJ family response regulator
MIPREQQSTFFHPQTVILISQDEAFVNRLHALGPLGSGGGSPIQSFEDPLAALVHMLEHRPEVVVYDMDTDTLERGCETLRAIGLICRRVPIILSATEHAAAPFRRETGVGVFYRIVKSAPDAELQTAVESALRFARQKPRVV